MHISVNGLGGIAAVIVLAGCGPAQGFSHMSVRPATDVPARFLVAGEAVAEMSGPPPRPPQGCRSPMVDPRDGTLLRISRSLEGLGDYEVPAGRYGVEAGELMRIDCGTGEAVGIVRR